MSKISKIEGSEESDGISVKTFVADTEELDVVGIRTNSPVPSSWDLSADVVIIGAGGAGLPASLAAQERGASVLVVDQNYDVGGHALMSAGIMHLGGGTSAQRDAGITDSPDLIFSDLTDWTIVEPNGSPDYRYNDPAFIRAFADNSVATWNLLVANGYKWATRPDFKGGSNEGNSAPRTVVPEPVPAGVASPAGSGGAAYVRPLEASARSKGVSFLLNYRMNSIIRETIYPSPSGNVLGIMAMYTGGRIMPASPVPLKSYAEIQGLRGNIALTQPIVNIRANKGVIIATGGHTSNVNFRRMIDPRLTEHITRGGDPYSFTDASGELAAMGVGASLWGIANEVLENGVHIQWGQGIGVHYNYLINHQESPIFPLTGGTGLLIENKQDVIYVNQVGERFWDETRHTGWLDGFPMSNDGTIKPYASHHYLNSQCISSSAPPGTPYNATDYNSLNAALAVNSGSVPPDYSAGPVWAIFDADAVTREKWSVTPPHVDIAGGYFFSASTLSELATALSANPYQHVVMSSKVLEATVARYNSFVDLGVDSDYGKPNPLYKILRPPFYAAWNTPCVHDSRSGVRINMQMQVIDWNGNIIPHLYCAGESAGGTSQHGLGRSSAGGYIAAKNVVQEILIS